MSVQIEIGGTSLELFKDEGVSLIKKALDYEKIGTSWSDFSYSFNVPASKVNNIIFQYYFNSEVIDGFNPFGTNSCRILIELQLRYTGTVRIVDVKFKDNLPLSYSVQFFSDGINLKEALKGKTIADINWSSYNHDITVTKVRDYLKGDAITGSYAEDLHYPFISVKSLLKWDNSNSLTYDEGVSFASAAGDGILFDEFRPAAPFSLIVRELFNLAGFNIDNKLELDATYNKAHIWLNNSEQLVGASNKVQQSMARVDSRQIVYTVRPVDFPVEIDNDGGFMEYGGFRMPKTETYLFKLNTSIDVPYEYRIVINGVGQTYIDMTGLLENTITVALTLNDFITFEFRPKSTFQMAITSDTSMLVTSQNAFLSNFVVSKYVPKLDAVKFLQGVLDMFNALMYWDSTTAKFIIQNRTDWLAAGTEVDISRSIDSSSKTMRPPTFFNTLRFAMGEGKDIGSELFADVYGRSHGTTEYTIGNVYGDTFTRSVPFTLPLMHKIITDKEDGSAGPQTTKNIVTTTSVDKSYKPINPNAFIFIKEAAVRDSVDNWKVTDYTGATAESRYSNDFRLDTSTGETLSFSTILTADGITLRTKTLFSQYYTSYIDKLYGQDIRRMKFSGQIPINIVSYINANDTLVINLVKYIIEDITSNTLTGISTLNLITK